jgi:hypothetical protein
LIIAVFENPESILAVDHSVNSRIGGLIAGLNIVLENLFIPAGLSNKDWISHIPHFLRQYPWLFDLSTAGIPSGVVIVIYQMGLLGVFLIFFSMCRIVSAARSVSGTYILIVAVIVFWGQYLISNPLFGLLYGCAVASLRTKYNHDHFLGNR